MIASHVQSITKTCFVKFASNSADYKKPERIITHGKEMYTCDENNLWVPLHLFVFSNWITLWVAITNNVANLRCL